MYEEFLNKVVAVTGGVSGIGKAVVSKFIQHGAIVAIIDRDETNGKILVDQLNETETRVHFFSCDVTDEVQVKKTYNRINEELGKINYAFNNAGYGGKSANIENYPVDDWDRVMAINLRAVFLCMKYQIPYIINQHAGAIVNCASVLSTVANENDSAYVASKFGVLGLTKNAALEYARSGLRINSISPGFTLTPMITYAPQEKLDEIANDHAIGRLAQPGEIAEGVLWLCSERSSFAVGMNLLLDGGYTLT